MNLLVSTVAMALGAFAVASPRRAVEIWGAKRLRGLPADRGPSFVRWFRIFGSLLFLAGVLFAIDSILLARFAP